MIVSTTSLKCVGMSVVVMCHNVGAHLETFLLFEPNGIKAARQLPDFWTRELLLQEQHHVCVAAFLLLPDVSHICPCMFYRWNPPKWAFPAVWIPLKLMQSVSLQATTHYFLHEVITVLESDRVWHTG